LRVPAPAAALRRPVVVEVGAEIIVRMARIGQDGPTGGYFDASGQMACWPVGFPAFRRSRPAPGNPLCRPSANVGYPQVNDINLGLKGA
jgi:hypothetical protein